MTLVMPDLIPPVMPDLIGHLKKGSRASDCLFHIKGSAFSVSAGISTRYIHPSPIRPGRCGR